MLHRRPLGATPITPAADHPRAAGIKLELADRDMPEFHPIQSSQRDHVRVPDRRLVRIPVLDDQRLYQQLRPQRRSLQSHHSPPVDRVSHHDPHHGYVEAVRLPEVAAPRRTCTPSRSVDPRDEHVAQAVLALAVLDNPLGPVGLLVAQGFLRVRGTPRVRGAGRGPTRVSAARGTGRGASRASPGRPSTADRDQLRPTARSLRARPRTTAQGRLNTLSLTIGDHGSPPATGGRTSRSGLAGLCWVVGSRPGRMPRRARHPRWWRCPR